MSYNITYKNCRNLTEWRRMEKRKNTYCSLLSNILVYHHTVWQLQLSMFYDLGEAVETTLISITRDHTAEWNRIWLECTPDICCTRLNANVKLTMWVSNNMKGSELSNMVMLRALRRETSLTIAFCYWSVKKVSDHVCCLCFWINMINKCKIWEWQVTVTLNYELPIADSPQLFLAAYG